MEETGLRLPPTLGVGQAQKTSIIEAWSTYKDVETDVTSRIADAKLPTREYEEVSADTLSNPDSREYTENYAFYLGWFSYANEELAKVEARVLQYENIVEQVTAETRVQLRERAKVLGTKYTVEEMKDLLALTPEYKEALRELQVSQQERLLLKAKVERMDRSLRVISRQVELRKLDWETSQTGHNLQNRGRRF